MEFFYRLSLRQLFGCGVLFSIILTVSAFVLEYGFDAIPCRMCWWQRYGHWGVGALSLFGFILSYLRAPSCLKKGAFFSIVFIAVVTFSVALYQSLGQFGLVQLPAVCGASASHLASDGADLLASLAHQQKIPDCSSWGFVILGLSLAMWNVLIMGSLITYLTKWYFVNRKNGGFEG